MVRIGVIKDDFFRKSILRDRLLAILTSLAVLALFYLYGRTYLVFAVLLVVALFLIDLPGLLRKYRHHRELISWLDHQRSSTILAYSTRVKYLDTIERHVIPHIPADTIIVKLDDHRYKGKIPRSIWFELARKTRMPQLPVIIRIHHRNYKVIQIRRYLNEFLENRNDVSILIDNLKIHWTSSGSAQQ